MPRALTLFVIVSVAVAGCNGKSLGGNGTGGSGVTGGGPPAPLGTLWVWLAFSETPAVATLIAGGIVLAAVLVDILAPHRPAMVTQPQ